MLAGQRAAGLSFRRIEFAMSNGTPPVAASRRPSPPIDDDQRWHELVSQVGVEIAEPLTAALERINVLTATGKIDRAGLRALRDEVEQARQAGMIGQQLTRFAIGPGAPVARGAAARGGAEERARAAHARDPGARHRPQARPQVGARHRRRLAPLQPAQRDARLGAGERARAHRLRGRLQDLAGARAADLPLREPPGRPGRRERHDRRSRRASTRSPGA